NNRSMRRICHAQANGFRQDFRRRHPSNLRRSWISMNNLSVGLIQGREAIDVELKGKWGEHVEGEYRFTSPVTLTPTEPNASFTLNDVTIGIGFHWERNEPQSFRGGLRIIQDATGLTAINDIELEDYVTSVISSEMSASCPI